MNKPLRLLIPIVVAVALGPLVAGLVVCLASVVINFADPNGGMPIADMLVFFPFYIVFAYVEGAPIALLAGLLVAVWMLWRPAGLIVAVGAGVAAVGLFWLADRAGLLSASGGSVVRNNLLLTLGLAAIAAGVCWLLTRRFTRRDPPA